MLKLELNENFICRIWEDNSNYKDLFTTCNEKVEIFDIGKKNFDAGPDYNEAKVRIGEKIYTGCIEIHRSLKDWHDHHHKNDDKYNEVILQVVLYDDGFDNYEKSPVVKRSRIVPTVILSQFLTRPLKEIWKEIISNPSSAFKLPCYPKNKQICYDTKINWISSLSFKRLIYKTEKIDCRLRQISENLKKKYAWEQLLFEFTCEALGYSKNKKQFLRLAEKVNVNKLRENKLNLIQTESLLYGLSGFMKDLHFKDKYIADLKESRRILKEIFMEE
ncbi:MAG: DUF2851 family protein, partial [Ignavibacteria bacterium]